MDPALQQLVAGCVRRYVAWSGRAAEVVGIAPGRVNLIGEHTDYNDGFVLPMAIDRWCVAVGGRGEGGRGRAMAMDLGEECEFEIEGTDAAGLPRWARYVAGMVWSTRDAARARGRGEVGAVDVMVSSSVPMGAGLSSSAAMELATGTMVNELFGLGFSKAELAELGRATEHRYAGVPCGIMDQMVSACAAEGSALLIDCRSMGTRAVGLPGGVAIVVADSGVRRSLAEGEYAKRAAACASAAKGMGVSSLREVDGVTMTDCRGLSGSELACARHVVSENGRVLGFVKAVESGNVRYAGRLMRDSHDSLRDDFRVSCAELDAMVESALEVEGVYGSRMTGAGFGGCTVTMCRAEVVGEVVRGIAELTRGRGGIEPFVVRAVGGAEARRA